MRINIEQALRLLRAGNIVAIPTDTVYGIAANMHETAAVDQIFAIKKRPNDKPLITLMADHNQILPFVDSLPRDFNKLADHFWPGALTLVVPIKIESIPRNVRAGLATAGFRIPNHALTRELLNRFGPVVAPSANLSAGPAATCAEHVEADFGNSFPVLDGGPCAKGIESTILCYQEGRWQISRLGAISAQDIGNILGYEPNMMKSLSSALSSRYVPKVKLILSTKPYDGNIKSVLGFVERKYQGATNIFVLGSLQETATIGTRLYTILREIDQKGIQEVWVDFDFQAVGEFALLAAKLKSLAKHS